MNRKTWLQEILDSACSGLVSYGGSTPQHQAYCTDISEVRADNPNESGLGLV